MSLSHIPLSISFQIFAIIFLPIFNHFPTNFSPVVFLSHNYLHIHSQSLPLSLLFFLPFCQFGFLFRHLCLFVSFNYFLWLFIYSHFVLSYPSIFLIFPESSRLTDKNFFEESVLVYKIDRKRKKTLSVVWHFFFCDWGSIRLSRPSNRKSYKKRKKRNVHRFLSVVNEG